MVDKIRKEDEEDKKLESAARASLISKHKDSIAEAIIENPQFDEKQTKQAIKHLNDDKSIKDAADKHVGLKEKSKKPGLSEQFKEALTFFAPQLIGGAIGAAMEGDVGLVAGAEKAGQMRDSYIDYKQQMAELALKEQRRIPAKKGVQQTDFVTADGEPVLLDPNDGKFKKSDGSTVEAATLKNSITLRQENSLKRADQRISLSKDKFAIDIKKASQLSDKQVETITSLDSTLRSMSRIDEYFKDTKTGPVIGRLQTVAQLADQAPEMFTKLKVEADNMLANYVKFISGAQVSDRERAMFEKMMPRVNDAPGVFKNKLEAFNRIISEHRDDLLNRIKTGQPIKAETIKAIEEAAANFEDVTPEEKKSEIGRRKSIMSDAQRKRLEELRNKHR